MQSEFFKFRSSCHGEAETNLTRNHEVVGFIPGLSQWVKDLVLLWLWCRPAATVPIRSLAWEPTYASSMALKSKSKKKLQIHIFTCSVKRLRFWRPHPFFFLTAPWHAEFLGQGSDLSHSQGLSLTCGNNGSVTCVPVLPRGCQSYCATHSRNSFFCLT